MKEKKKLVSCTEFMIGPFNHIGICLVNEMKDKVQSVMKELILIVSFFGLYRTEVIKEGRFLFVCVQKQK